MNIYVSINTNHGFGETKIEDGAIHEFTTNGFMEGTYDARVEFRCLPAAVAGDALSIIIAELQEFMDYGEMIKFYAGICRAVIKFLRKCHGYHKTIEIDGLEDIPEIIEVPDSMTEEELEARVFAILEIERKNISRDVSEIMEADRGR